MVAVAIVSHQIIGLQLGFDLVGKKFRFMSSFKFYTIGVVISIH